MFNPLRSIDRWASRSGERAALLLWLAMAGMALLAVLALLGVVWYTTPAAPVHGQRGFPAGRAKPSPPPSGRNGVNIGGVNHGTSGDAAINGGTRTATSGHLNAGNADVTGSLTVSGGGVLIIGSSLSFADINASATDTARGDGKRRQQAATASGGTWTANGSIIAGDKRGFAG